MPIRTVRGLSKGMGDRLWPNGAKLLEDNLEHRFLERIGSLKTPLSHRQWWPVQPMISRGPARQLLSRHRYRQCSAPSRELELRLTSLSFVAQKWLVRALRRSYLVRRRLA